jgi:hypothetical protein
MNNTVKELCSGNRAAPCLFYPVAKGIGMSVQGVLTASKKRQEVLVGIVEEHAVSAVIVLAALWGEAAAFGMRCTMGDADSPTPGPALLWERMLERGLVRAPYRAPRFRDVVR